MTRRDWVRHIVKTSKSRNNRTKALIAKAAGELYDAAFDHGSKVTASAHDVAVATKAASAVVDRYDADFPPATGHPHKHKIKLSLRDRLRGSTHVFSLRGAFLHPAPKDSHGVHDPHPDDSVQVEQTNHTPCLSCGYREVDVLVQRDHHLCNDYGPEDATHEHVHQDFKSDGTHHNVAHVPGQPHTHLHKAGHHGMRLVDANKDYVTDSLARASGKDLDHYGMDLQHYDLHQKDTVHSHREYATLQDAIDAGETSALVRATALFVEPCATCWHPKTYHGDEQGACLGPKGFSCQDQCLHFVAPQVSPTHGHRDLSPTGEEHKLEIPKLGSSD